MNVFKTWVPNWLAKVILFAMLVPNMVVFFLPVANVEVAAGYHGIEPSDVQFTILLYYAGFASFYCLERRFFSYFTSKQYFIQFQLFQLLCCYILFSSQIPLVLFTVRFVQGMLFGCSVSLYMSMATRFMKSHRAREMSYSIFFGMLLCISSLNNLVTADLIDQYNFDMVYKACLLLFSVSVLAVLVCISPVREYHRHSLNQLDMSSFMLLGTVLTAIGYLSVYGQQYYWLEGSTNIWAMGLLCVALGLFFIRQLVLRRPYIDLSVLKEPKLLLGILLLFLMYIERFSFSLVGTFYKDVFRLDPRHISYLFVFNILGIVWGVGAAAWHQLAGRNTIWVWFVGFLSLLVYHLSMIQLLDNAGNEAYFILPLAAHGLGIGLIMVPTILFVIGVVPFRLAPSAAAICLLVRFLGYSASVVLDKYFSIYHYTVHYARFLEHIGGNNSFYQDRIRQISLFLNSNGLERELVATAAQKVLKTQVDNQILLRSIMDYYSLMAYLSIGVLIFLLVYLIREKKIHVHFRPMLPI